jgi:hypothetical protein
MRVHPLEWRRVIAAVAILALLAAPASPQGTDPELVLGLRQVSEGDFEAAVVTLDAAAHRLAASGQSKGDLLQAYLSLGTAFVALDQRSAARDRFRLALALDPRVTLGPDRYSPKVIGVFEEARREAEAEAKRAATAVPPEKSAKGGGPSKTILAVLGAAAAVGGGIALATRGQDPVPPDVPVRFTGARFGTPVIGCEDGAINTPLSLNILVDALGGTTATAVGTVTAVLIVRESPAFPGEVGFATNSLATVSPQAVPARSGATLRVDTTLLCNNGAGDEARFNTWSALLTLATSAGNFTIETADRMRVNIP